MLRVKHYRNMQFFELISNQTKQWSRRNPGFTVRQTLQRDCTFPSITRAKVARWRIGCILYRMRPNGSWTHGWLNLGLHSGAMKQVRLRGIQNHFNLTYTFNGISRRGRSTITADTNHLTQLKDMCEREDIACSIKRLQGMNTSNQVLMSIQQVLDCGPLVNFDLNRISKFMVKNHQAFIWHTLRQNIKQTLGGFKPWRRRNIIGFFIQHRHSNILMKHGK